LVRKNADVLTVLSLFTISIGSMVEIIPTLSLKKSVPTISAVKPYSPLELKVEIFISVKDVTLVTLR
jgi:cbb3-type cytochrome oxidase cytochrome c subunit